MAARSKDLRAPKAVEELSVNRIIQGDCVEVLKTLPEKSVDLVFADPPYNLQLKNELLRPNQTVVDGVDDEWDQFSDFTAYDDFTTSWLSECRRILKDEGAIWVIGSYHNIFRVGKTMMDLGYWILNDVVWHKTNPMPNFRGTRFTNATETLVWAKKSETQKKYTFNYHAMKNLNDEKQMTNVWNIPLCTGHERIKSEGKKAHSTQKPEALLYRVILSSSNPGDTVLDPFFGSGTTGAVAKKLGRNYHGIELDPGYIEVAEERIRHLPPCRLDKTELVTPSKRTAPRVGFAQLIESRFLNVGQKLFSKDRNYEATIRADSHLLWDNLAGSIHKIAAVTMQQSTFNGWDYWHFEDSSGELHSIDELRSRYRAENCQEDDKP